MFTLKFQKSFQDSRQEIEQVYSVDVYTKHSFSDRIEFTFTIGGQLTLVKVSPNFAEDDSFAVCYIENDKGKTISVTRYGDVEQVVDHHVV